MPVFRGLGIFEKIATDSRLRLEIAPGTYGFQFQDPVGLNWVEVSPLTGLIFDEDGATGSTKPPEALPDHI